MAVTAIPLTSFCQLPPTCCLQQLEGTNTANNHQAKPTIYYGDQTNTQNEKEGTRNSAKSKNKHQTNKQPATPTTNRQQTATSAQPCNPITLSQLRQQQKQQEEKLINQTKQVTASGALSLECLAASPGTSAESVHGR